MFSKAYTLATAFTRPVIISTVRISGACSAAIGSFVVVNDDGWIITAAHIVKEYQNLETAKQTTLTNPMDPNGIKDYSFWWCSDGSKLQDIALLESGDLAVGRLVPFDRAQKYPTFKDPDKPIAFGTSLCRLGFPFHQIQPTHNGAAFQLPPQTFPMVFFPNDGILTRVLVVDQNPPNFVAFLETSSAGLPGQSGGPIFDREGTVWGIQSHTSSLPLGFTPPVPGGPTGQVEHQFLNVGRGAHPKTVIDLLKQVGIKHTVSNY